MRLRFWLAAHDLAERLRLPFAIQLWLLCRACDAEDWTDDRDGSEGDEPW